MPQRRGGRAPSCRRTGIGTRCRGGPARAGRGPASVGGARPFPGNATQTTGLPGPRTRRAGPMVAPPVMHQGLASPWLSAIRLSATLLCSRFLDCWWWKTGQWQCPGEAGELCLFFALLPSRFRPSHHGGRYGETPSACSYPSLVVGLSTLAHGLGLLFHAHRTPRWLSSHNCKAKQSNTCYPLA